MLSAKSLKLTLTKRVKAVILNPWIFASAASRTLVGRRLLLVWKALLGRQCLVLAVDAFHGHPDLLARLHVEAVIAEVDVEWAGWELAVFAPWFGLELF